MVLAPSPSGADRQSCGKEARTRLPLRELGRWRADREAMALVRAQNALRVADVGVGSVGLRVHLLLLDGGGGADPLFLQVKQAVPSVYEAHLRPVAIASYIGKGKRFNDSIAAFARGYEDQAEHDHAGLVAAIADGTVPAEPG